MHKNFSCNHWAREGRFSLCQLAFFAIIEIIIHFSSFYCWYGELCWLIFKCWTNLAFRDKPYVVMVYVTLDSIVQVLSKIFIMIQMRNIIFIFLISSLILFWFCHQNNVYFRNWIGKYPLTYLFSEL
jgi:hypothetical protein